MSQTGNHLHFRLPSRWQATARAMAPSYRAANRIIRELEVNDLTLSDVHLELGKAISEGRPYSMVRPGGTESLGLLHFIRYRCSSKGARRQYPRRFLRTAAPYSGIVARETLDYDVFFLEYLKGILNANTLGYGLFAHHSLGLMKRLADSGVPTTRIKNLDPYTALSEGLKPWSLSLSNKRVLIVHPFKSSIENQLERRETISGVRDWLPEFEFKILRPPTDLGFNGRDYSWDNHFSQLCEEVSSQEFDVALIGAGSYGLPLAHFVKSMGKVGVHLGGTTQLLFGINGSRWKDDSVLNRYVDRSWIFPAKEDLFEGVRGIEGGSYTASERSVSK